VDLLVAPSHLLTIISRAVFSVFLGFHPNGRSEIPLYKENFLEVEDCGRGMFSLCVLERSDDALEGGFGPAIVNAILILIAFCIFRRKIL
jgi:hypothetical protein